MLCTVGSHGVPCPAGHSALERLVHRPQLFFAEGLGCDNAKPSSRGAREGGLLARSAVRLDNLAWRSGVQVRNFRYHPQLRTACLKASRRRHEHGLVKERRGGLGRALPPPSHLSAGAATRPGAFHTIHPRDVKFKVSLPNTELTHLECFLDTMTGLQPS